VKLKISLRAQNHSGERAGNQHDRLGFHADEINLVNQIAAGNFATSKNGIESFSAKNAETPQASHPIGNPVSDHGHAT
jgi:hypothetical protein